MDDSDQSRTVADGPEGQEVTERMGAEAEGPAQERFPGAQGTLSRYVLLAKIGEGGMGEVYRAYDPQLKREVALKLVKTTRSDPVEQARLLREAQSMAQLSHPNVAAVYDAGEVDGQVYIALEFVEGVTLGAWLKAKKREYTEVLEVFKGAGRGLAAAHAAGLIHRDFKPANVLVPESGRPRVLDFGLARLAGRVDTDIDKTDETALSISAELDGLDTPLTEAGMVMGTPAYMALEQHYAAKPEPTWDVYAFCVALYEAFAGQRPFSGVGVRELAKAKRGGPTKNPPSSWDAPAWIYTVVRAGLEPNPARRTGSMDELLEQLDNDPARAKRRRRRILTTGAIGAGLAVGLVMAQQAVDDPCGGGASRIGELWDEDRATEIGESFASTELSFAGTTWERARASLDTFSTAWATEYEDACEATHVRGEQSAQRLDLRMQCLRRSERELGALLEVFASADEKVVEQAQLAVLDLPAPGRCADVATLETGLEPPDDAATATRVEEIRDQIASGRAKVRAGRYEDARALLDEATSGADETAYPPLQAEVLHARGEALWELGEPDAAFEALTEGFFVAVRSGHAQLARDSALDLAAHRSKQADRLHESSLWARQARALLPEEVQGGAPAAEVLRVEGVVASAHGRYEEAQTHLEGALDLFLAAYGPEDLRVAGVLASLANVSVSLGRYDEGDRHHVSAIGVYSSSLGEEHPSFYAAVVNRASALTEAGHTEQAAELLEGVVEGQRATLGPEHPDVVGAVTSLGYARFRQERYEESLELYQEALALAEKLHGPLSGEVAHLLNNISGCLQKLGRQEEVLAAMQRSLLIKQETLGTDHIDTALAYNNVGVAMRNLGRIEESIEYQEKAIDITRRTVGPMHFRLATFYRGLAVANLKLGDFVGAVEAYERELEVSLANGRNPDETAYVRWYLAKQLWEGDIDRKRALDEARKAKAMWELGDTPTKIVTAWIKERE